MSKSLQDHKNAVGFGKAGVYVKSLTSSCSETEKEVAEKQWKL